MTTALVPGSLQALAQQSGRGLAESFLSCDVIVLVDVSGSMAAPDAQGGQTRYDCACNELARLQREQPGKYAVISFADNVQFCPGGQPAFAGGGTHLDDALRFVQPADGTGVRFVVISDGWPYDPDGCIALAKQFSDTISTIFVGPEGDSGAEFLRRLAKASGGRHVHVGTARIHELAAGVKALLNAG